jgi:phage shock protein PspC (stress-responsive transcriptional regulator)
MTEQAPTNLMLRGDTILGVCEALGQDFGISPTWFRVAFCAPIFWNPVLVISAYFGIGLLVAASRFAFPDRTVGVHTSAPAQPAVDTAAAASDEVQERELIAA